MLFIEQMAFVVLFGQRFLVCSFTFFLIVGSAIENRYGIY